VYPHQAERLADALERAGLDALVAMSPENIAYVTGFRSLTHAIFNTLEFGIFTRQGVALVVPCADVPTVIADAIDVDHIVCFGELAASLTEPPPTTAIRRIQALVAGRAADPVEALARALDRLGVRRGSVGVDESGFTYQSWRRLADRLGEVELVAAAAHLATARRVKSPYEIDCLGRALLIAEESLDAVIQTMERGMTEREAATLYGAEVIKRGAWPRPAVVAMGEHAAIPAPWPTDRALRTGDLVRFEVGCLYKGYHSRVGRCAVLGEPTASRETAYRAIQSGLEAAIAAVAPGVAAEGVFQIALEAIRANGLSRYEAFHVGDGIGLEPREPPRLMAGSETAIEMGEVLAVQTSYYEIGSMGATVANTILVTSAGARVLNRSRAGLFILD
jgi:Xaa-Pro dipeptidase